MRGKPRLLSARLPRCSAPDIAAQAQPYLAGPLDWVGMDGIEVPVRFDADDRIADFHVRLEHQESPHPHDAVAYTCKETSFL
jgi:GTP cyclohydrolase FolE2